MNTEGKLDHRAQEMKGHVEETAGRVFGDDKLMVHGTADRVAAQAKQAATLAGDTARRVGNRFRDRAMAKIAEFHQRLHEAADREAKEEEQQREHKNV